MRRGAGFDWEAASKLYKLDGSDAGRLRKTVTFYPGWRGQKDIPKGRQVDIGARKIHRVPLEPGEVGRLAKIEGDGFAFPFLYSIPPYWSKSPHQLLVPKAVAKADGLTPAE